MRERLKQVLVPVVVVLAVFVAGRHSRAQQKAPVPDAAAEQAAKKTAGEIYGGQFALVKTAAEKMALAAQMIDAALKVRDGSPVQHSTIARSSSAVARWIARPAVHVRSLRVIIGGWWVREPIFSRQEQGVVYLFSRYWEKIDTFKGKRIYSIHIHFPDFSVADIQTGAIEAIEFEYGLGDFCSHPYGPGYKDRPCFVYSRFKELTYEQGVALYTYLKKKRYALQRASEVISDADHLAEIGRIIGRK